MDATVRGGDVEISGPLFRFEDARGRTSLPKMAHLISFRLRMSDLRVPMQERHLGIQDIELGSGSGIEAFLGEAESLHALDDAGLLAGRAESPCPEAS